MEDQNYQLSHFLFFQGYLHPLESRTFSFPLILFLAANPTNTASSKLKDYQRGKNLEQITHEGKNRGEFDLNP